MKSEENCWIKFAPLFCSSHFSFSTSFIIIASTENRPTAVTHHSSPAAQVLTAFLLLFSFLPRKTKEIGFLFFGLLRGMLFSAVLMGYCNTINPLGNRPENCLTLCFSKACMKTEWFKCAFNCFAVPGLELAAFYCTSNKVHRRTLTALDRSS